MTARAIPPELESEVVAKSQEGWSLRRISQWLLEEKKIYASHTTVAGVLQRHGANIQSLLDVEMTRQFTETLPATLAELSELTIWYREIFAAGLLEDPPKRLGTSLQAARSLQALLFFKLRACGVNVPRNLTPGTPPPVETAPPAADAAPSTTPAEQASAAVEGPTPPVPSAPKSTAPSEEKPSPSRTRPCPCGSGRKYKHCHGAEQKKESLALAG
jgi:hypothetical protein